MLKLLRFTTVVALAMSISACGHQEDKTVINYCRALEAGKLDAAASYLSRDARKALDMSGGTSRLAEAGEAFKQHKGIDEIRVTKRDVAGERATIFFVYKFKDGMEVGDYFPLVKEDGAWKIAK